MKTEDLQKFIADNKLFKGLDDAFLELVAGCAKNVVFHAGDYLFHEGEPASDIYLVRHGHVRLEISAPGHGMMTFATLGTDDLIGLSWLVPPYRWTFDARAVELTRAIAMDATCLRTKCDADPKLGYEIMKRFMPVIVDRLHATRLQLLDVYGKRSKN
jgi:CRP-like cAMP-binding protein